MNSLDDILWNFSLVLGQWEATEKHQGGEGQVEESYAWSFGLFHMTLNVQADPSSSRG